jgi:uridine phosphorylase
VTEQPVALHLRTSSPLAPDALIPGDPARAMALAQHLLTEPVMHNLSRGLWGYSGETREGRRLSIQSTGMGGPSAAIVLQELGMLGVRRAIRVGTCGALDPSLQLGELLRAEAALPADGVSRGLGAEGPVPADPGLLGRLDGVGRPVTVATTDFFYEPSDEPRRGWIDAGAAAVEMEAAALFALGPRVGVAVACLLVVSDVFPGGERRRIGDEELLEAAQAMGDAAASALAG